ncbi:MAG: hypothetical protein AAF449_17985, partial [Myxococcota bacterium]
MPSFTADALHDRAAAFGRRAKAIKYHAARFSCTRELEDGDERFNIDFESLEKHPTSTRLSSWPDGALWLGVYQSAPRREGGWAFAYSGSGSIASLDAAAVVSIFEQTLA